MACPRVFLTTTHGVLSAALADAAEGIRIRRSHAVRNGVRVRGGLARRRPNMRVLLTDRLLSCSMSLA